MLAVSSVPRPRLILMCGLPGSGKTTLARQLEVEISALRLCPDEWMTDVEVDLWDEAFRDRLEVRFWILAQDVLRMGLNVILESGFWLRSDRDEKRIGGHALNASVELIILDVGFEELVRRLEVRNAAGAHGSVAISRQQLETMVPFFDVPDENERALFDSTMTERAE